MAGKCAVVAVAETIVGGLTVIDPTTRAFVIERAKNHCEYCQLPQWAYRAKFQIDHVIASQHRRDDSADNLCLSCRQCNWKKGPNLSGIDEITQTIVRIFNPRADRWLDHFNWNSPYLVGLTPSGRATIAVLDLNSDERIVLRRLLMAESTFPPAADQLG